MKKTTKRIIVIIAAAVIVLALCAAVFILIEPAKDKPPSQNEVKGIEVTANISEDENIFVRINTVNMGTSEPSLEIEWFNYSENEYSFTNEFHIYRVEDGKQKDCRISEDYKADKERIAIPPKGSAVHDYDLCDIELSKAGEYRFEAVCQYNNTENKVRIDFRIDEPQYAVVGGRISLVTTNSIVLEVFNTDFCEKYGEKVYITKSMPEGKELPDLKYVSEIVVHYNGYVVDSSPAKITCVYDVIPIDNWYVDERGNKEKYICNGYERDKDLVFEYKVTESAVYDIDRDGNTENYYITDSKGNGETQYGYIAVEKDQQISLLTVDHSCSDYSFSIINEKLYLMGPTDNAASIPSCYVFEYKGDQVVLENARNIYIDVIYPTVIEEEFGEKPEGFPVGTPSYDTLKAVVLNYSEYNYIWDNYTSVLFFLSGKWNEYRGGGEDREQDEYEFYKALETVKISTYSLSDLIIDDMYTGYLWFSFTVTESKCEEFPEGDYNFALGNNGWERVGEPVTIPTEHETLYYMVDDIASCGCITWDNGEIITGNDREADAMMAYIIGNMPYAEDGWTYKDGISDDRLKKGAKELFGFDFSDLDLNKTSFNKNKDNGLWYSSTAPNHSSYAMIREIRDMGNGKFEIDVQFYADHYYLCPSHVVTYYATVTDDDVFKYCIEKAVITEEGNYEPF